MERTTVRVYFSLFGDEFPIPNVTEKLGIIPTETYKKGDLIPNRSPLILRKETSWTIDTGYQVSLDVSNQLQQIINQLKNKVSIINEIKKTYSLKCKFFIILQIENGDTPGLYLDNKQIEFANSIKAEFDIDLYVNPYERNFAK